jgi:hypothetical protein
MMLMVNVATQQTMLPKFQCHRLLLLTAIFHLLVGCGTRAPSPPDQAPAALAATPAATLPNTPDPRLATPSTALFTELLGDETAVESPILTVPISMTKAQLAAELFTTPALLDAFTQGLPDPVPQYAIVVVPRSYPAQAGETLTAIAESLDLPVAMLRVVNPALPLDTPFSVETRVRLPRLYTAPQDTTLAEVAAALQTTVEALLAANPALQPDQEIRAGQLLVIPATQ